nr:phosphonopyruvate decarboxylase [Butyrivibrio sp.]
MQVDLFLKMIGTITGGGDYYTGVPDSLLKPLCDYLLAVYGIDSRHHLIAANEGNAVGLAAGYYLATGRVPVVYMQNSGEGNIINPLASLLNDRVYAIPCIFIIGWRGEPGVHDEPQHIFQGEVTDSLLSTMGVEYCVISKETSEEELKSTLERFDQLLQDGKQVAFIIRKGALTAAGSIDFETMSDKKIENSKGESYPKREAIIEKIVEASENDLIVSTTGKASRELFELREANGSGHEKDFLTVGSMGHCSSIALSVAAFHPERRVWCVDGDGAMLMHMGSLPVIAQSHPKNMIHVVINNGAH